MIKEASKIKPYSPEKIALRIKFPPTYGRRKSRSLTDAQKKLLNEFYPKYAITVEKDSIKQFQKDAKGKKVQLEIGFGDGEHLVHQAKNNPKTLFVGCELYLNSFVVALQKTKKEALENVRFFNDDSRYLLEVFPENSLDKIYILFPDPWPKKKQFKRRIVSKHTLDMLNPLLKDGGVIRCATDIDSYFEQMLKVFAADNRFKLITKEKDFAKAPADHIETHYHRKAVREGRIPRFLEYSKVVS